MTTFIALFNLTEAGIKAAQDCGKSAAGRRRGVETETDLSRTRPTCNGRSDYPGDVLLGQNRARRSRSGHGADDGRRDDRTEACRTRHRARRRTANRGGGDVCAPGAE